MPVISKSFESLAASKIDRANGIISGVAAITIGQAKGHNIWIDGKTLESVCKVASEFEKGIKVKFSHGKTGEFQSVIDETCGVLKNFKIEGDKVRGDLCLLKSLSAERRETILEMAELMPEQFGLSIVFSGVNESKGGKDYLRCHELQSIDLTDKPAANPNGLFSMKTIKYESGDAGKHASDCMCGECEGKGKSKSMEELTALVTKLSEGLSAISEKLEKANAPATSLAFTGADGKTVQLSASDVFTQLEASKKFVADANKQLQDQQRKEIIGKLSSEGRVVMKEDGSAYKATELETLDLSFLKFAAKNSPVIPLVARATYTDTGKGPNGNLNGPDGKRLVGTELTTKAWEAAYSDLDKMLAAPMNTPLE